MLTRDFEYELPPELIAQEPPEVRSAARMMVLDRARERIEHRRVTDLPAFLAPGDRLVLNDTKVFPARVFGRWEDTPGRCEVLLVEPVEGADCWTALCRSARPALPGRRMLLAEGELTATILDRDERGQLTLQLHARQPLFDLLERYGAPPVPPYIRRTRGDDRTPLDRARYQTVYAREIGSVAAPTAGLHFTPELLDQLERSGVGNTRITLHVGPGTFKPVQTEDPEAHRMDSERYGVTSEAAAAIEATRERGGRVVAVGSTSVRTLETIAAAHRGRIVAGQGRSALFIRPPYRFLVTDALLTNFHLPRSTLLMMVSAFAGRERVLAAYAEAVRERYRFFSYGDCMLIV